MDFLTPLTPDCPALLFPGKFADIAALNSGNRDLLRPKLQACYQLKTTQEQRENATALIIGGNGFVGTHLVARLSLDDKIKHVYTTVRALADKTPLQRFEEIVHFYQIKSIGWEKITVIDATPLAPHWGLNVEDYKTLSNQVDLLFACVSSTDYSQPYLEYRKDWMLSLLQMLQFCLEGKNKHFTYLGSVSSRLYTHLDDFIRPDSWWYSGYAQMKWVNGEILRWIAHDQLLPITLCEANYIFGSTIVGIDPGLHYSWWRAIEVAKNIGKFWSGDGLNYCPVDILADALVINALTKNPLTYLHPCNPIPYDNTMLAKMLHCEIVAWKNFKETALSRISSKSLEKLLEEDANELIKRVNTSAIFPPDYSYNWCNNEKLFSLYLEKIPFRNIKKFSTIKETA